MTRCIYVDPDNPHKFNQDDSCVLAQMYLLLSKSGESMTMADGYSPGGIYLGTAPAINLDQDIMDRFMERMTRALLYQEYSIGYVEGEIEWKKTPTKERFDSMLPEMKALLLSVEPKRIGNDIFTYVGYRGTTVSLWIMSFYGGAKFQSLFRAH